MDLNSLLSKCDIDPKTVLVFRHRPSEPQLNKVLPWLVVEKPKVFNAYQQIQGEKVEKAMQSAKFVASFLGREAGKALYVGLYRVLNWKPLAWQQCASLAEIRELVTFGMTPFSGGGRRCYLWFDLKRTDFFSDWIGKLIVSWPGKELSWWRWADRNAFLVQTIHEESVLDAAIPDWDKMNFTWDELHVLPKRWRAAMREWRGIYFVFDSGNRKGYVGSACGDDNILGRWENYAATGHGGNRLLKKRFPANFRFSILQRVSPDMLAKEVIQIESTWKERLHTRHPFGLNDN